jgi:hypothetical protein
MSIADYGKIIQERMDREQYVTEKKQYHHETYLEGRMRQFETVNDFLEEFTGGQDTRTDLSNGSPFPMGRLSPQATDTIYECYL